MKNIIKKGFTIVELVIVIAVIAILAGVLIPTFSGVVSNANASAAQQEAKTALTNALAMSSNASLPANTVFVIDYDGKESDSDTTLAPDYRFDYNGNKLEAADLKKDNAIEVLLITKYDRVIIAEDAITKTSDTTPAYSLGKIVQSIIKSMFGATSLTFSAKDATTNGYYQITVTVGGSNYLLKAYVCSDFETNIVTFVYGTNKAITE